MVVINNNFINNTSKKFNNFINRGSKARVIKKFADKSGLLYFGTVDQNSDDHKVVRGFTVSSSHNDNHYTVGTLGGYNISIVDRSDDIWQPDGTNVEHNWAIMAFELHTQQRIPHFLISANNHDIKPYGTLFSSFPNMLPITLGTFENYEQDFTSRFTIFARPAKAIEIEKIFPSKICRVIGTHLWPLSVEQHDNYLYIYAANEKITLALLETMLENGIWLAGHLDTQAELV